MKTSDFNKFDAAMTELINESENLKAVNAGLVDVLKKVRRGYAAVAEQFPDHARMAKAITYIDAALADAGVTP